MLETETICYKISRCLELIEDATKTKNLDVGSLATFLHDIRRDAQAMENGLRWRAEIMHDAGLEEEYQKTKKGKLTPPGINNIANTPDEQVVEGRPEYEVTVKQDGKLLYQNKAYAGAFAAVERFDDIDRFGTITGQSQQFYFGHPLLIFYAFNQLQNGMEGKRLAIMTAFHQAMSKKKDVDPAVKEVLRKMANK